MTELRTDGLICGKSPRTFEKVNPLGGRARVQNAVHGHQFPTVIAKLVDLPDELRIADGPFGILFQSQMLPSAGFNVVRFQSWLLGQKAHRKGQHEASNGCADESFVLIGRGSF
jgi:hypothetical protein